MRSRVFHCNDRLRREVLQQRDLLVRERPHFLAINDKNSDEGLVLPQGNPESGARASQLDEFHSVGSTGPVSLRIDNVANLNSLGLAANQALHRASRFDDE